MVPILTVAVGCAMLWWTWGAWLDVLVDFGRELYLPWQITNGKVLYRDLASFNGPFSPYVNSIWFRLFGVSLRSLVLANTAIAVILAILLYRILLVIGGRASAVAGGLVFVTMFLCAQYSSIDNYNFISPYSHELTHGLVLSVAGILLFYRYVRRQSTKWLIAAGLCAGLTFLTKTEVFTALAVALAAGSVAFLWVTRQSPRIWLRLLATLIAAASVPALVAIVLFSFAMGFEPAVAAVASPWRPLLNPVLRNALSSLLFYRIVLGTFDPVFSLTTFLKWSGWYAALLAPAYFIARRSQPLGDSGRAARLMFLLIAIVGVASYHFANYWPQAAAPLPLVVLLWLAATIISLIQERRDRESAARLILALTWASFSGALLLKILFAVWFAHYGFALALPATLGAVVVLMDAIPNHIVRKGGSPAVFRGAAAGVLLALVVGSLLLTDKMLALKTVAVGRGADAFRSDARGAIVNEALSGLARRVKAGETLAVLPEGVMINYLARRQNPTPYINFMPPEMVIFGEGQILDGLRAHAPDYVAIVHKDAREYGLPFFGADGRYGRAIMQWVESEYEPVALFGAEPLRDERFGIRLLHRKGSGP